MSTNPSLATVRQYDLDADERLRPGAARVGVGPAALQQMLTAALAAGALPDQVAAQSSSLSTAFRADVEGWATRADHLFVLGPDAARALVTTRRDALELAPLLRLPKWLHLARSARQNGPVLLPEGYAGLDFPAQACALARFLTSSDGRVPLDFEVVARVTHPDLRPALVYWFLATYLASPLSSAETQVSRNRERAAAGFQRFFEFRAQPMPALTPLPPVPSGFPGVEAVVIDRVLGPTLDRVIDVASPTTWPIGLAARADVGVVVEARASTICTAATEEALAPALAGVRALAISPGARPVGGAFQNHAWLSGACTDLVLTAQLAERMIGERLDLLLHVLPVGNTAGALASRRLARISAVVGGTSPAGQADYAIVGAEMQLPDAGLAGRPRRLVIPGLGVWMRPALPSRERDRKPGDRRVLATSVAPASSLDAHSLAAWDAALGGRARLHLVPGLAAGALGSAVDSLAAALSHTDVTVSPAAGPQACADLLVDADVYLHVPGDLGALTALAAGCPVVARAGGDGLVPAVMRAIGLPDWLIARSAAEYSGAIRRLVADPGLRVEIRASIDRAAVLNVLADPGLPDYLAAAVAWMRETGPSSGGHPVRIDV